MKIKTACLIHPFAVILCMCMYLLHYRLVFMLRREISWTCLLVGGTVCLLAAWSASSASCRVSRIVVIDLLMVYCWFSEPLLFFGLLLRTYAAVQILFLLLLLVVSILCDGVTASREAGTPRKILLALLMAALTFLFMIVFSAPTYIGNLDLGWLWLRIIAFLGISTELLALPWVKIFPWKRNRADLPNSR